MPFPMQRCFQTPDLLFGAFDHLFLRIRSDGQSESHPDSRMQFTPILGAVIPQVFDSMRYGNGMSYGNKCRGGYDGAIRILRCGQAACRKHGPSPTTVIRHGMVGPGTRPTVVLLRPQNSLG